MRLCAKYFSTPRSQNDYATHIPVLVGLPRLRKIKRVLEFGCGYYSTPTFLNRSAFPDLEQLQSVENDVSWAETLEESVNDERWTLKLVTGEIAASVADLDLEGFDLILIDDSKTSAQRASTIRAVADRQPQHPWIVIHDFEIAEYRNAAKAFKQRHAFKVYNPQTGLVGNNVGYPRLLGRRLKEMRKDLEPDDLEGWTDVFQSSEFKL